MTDKKKAVLRTKTCICGSTIHFIKSATSGKAMPCDIAKVTVVTPEGSVVQGYTPHWSTCPKAGQFRRGQRS